MHHEKSPRGVITYTFEIIEEVEAVRAAFVEHNTYLRSSGLGFTVTDFSTKIEGWVKAPQEYITINHAPLVARLLSFAESSEERVEKILDRAEEDPNRIPDAANQYRLRYNTMCLLEKLGQYAIV